MIKSLFWKPSVGKQTIRIVPSKFNKSTPFSELYFHYGIGKPVMISPINWGEKDPIVEFAKQLRKTDNPENWKLAKKIEPKVRYFAPVVVRGMEMKELNCGSLVKNCTLHSCKWLWTRK
jgi:hypothetical protein